MNVDINVPASSINPGQWTFLNSKAHIPLLCGGFGSGKTTGLSIKFLQLKIKNGPKPGLVVSQTYRSLWSITYPRIIATLKKNLPNHLMPKLVDKNGACYLLFWDGCMVYLRSAHRPETIDGLDVAWAVGDELRHWSKRAYEIVLGRVRLDCPLPQVAFSSTPAMHWMANEFYHRQNADRQLIIAPTKENEKHLAPGFIEQLRMSYSPRLQRAVVDGEFTLLEGAVYEAFAPYSKDSINMMDYKYNPSKKTFLAVDPGFRRSSWLFLQEFEPNKLVVFDQMQPDGQADATSVMQVNAKKYKIDQVWCDPAADSVQGAFGLDVVQVMRSIEFRSSQSAIRYITGIYRSIPYGVDKVRVMLGDKSTSMPARLFFSKDLAQKEILKIRGVVKSLAAYSYPEAREGHVLVDTPLKDGFTDHDCDALRYLIVGYWLSNPELKRLDPRLKDEVGGFKVAA